MKPFNTHEKRLFVQMYVAAFLGAQSRMSAASMLGAVEFAADAWKNALEAGLIQDHDAEPVSDAGEVPR